MAFESLTDKLQDVFKKLRGKGKLTEADIDAAAKEIKMALLEADVNFKVVKKLISDIKERAVGTEVMGSLTPGQQVIKIVHEEMISLMGSEVTEISLRPASETTILMMMGLQGAGKTTTCAKLASKFKTKGYTPLLVAADIYRPAAIEQLKVNGQKVGIPVFAMGTASSAVDIVKAATSHAKENSQNLIIIDTAGRLQIDDDMMGELEDIKAAVDVSQCILVVDAMTGQEAVNVAKTFDEKIGIDGVIVTKLDGDTRGGAALSIKAVTGKPIVYAGMGEKLSDLEPFHPDRMASRILGMGDVLSLIEKVQDDMDIEAAKKLSSKVAKAEFDFNDFLEQMKQIKKMGGINDILSMLPGMSSQMKNMPMVDDGELGRIEAIILSMTYKERSNPSILDVSRRQRVARGSGTDIAEVNRLVKQFEQMRKMMKQLGGMNSKKTRGMLGNMFGGMKLQF